MEQTIRDMQRKCAVPFCKRTPEHFIREDYKLEGIIVEVMLCPLHLEEYKEKNPDCTYSEDD